MQIQFWFEFASTYSYPAAMRIERNAAAAGVDLVWRAFLLGPIFANQGLQDSPFNQNPAKGRYMWRDLERICETLELPFRQPSAFPQNSLLAARVACRFADESWLPAFVKSVYRANFEHDLNIADEAVVRQCLSVTADDADALMAEAQTRESKLLLRRQTESAVALGIFGAPSFIVGDQLFWGNDRLEQALTWAKRQ